MRVRVVVRGAERRSGCSGGKIDRRFEWEEEAPNQQEINERVK